MNDFINGAIAVAYAVAGLFFFRFWKDSGDRLFAWFGTAFFILSGNRLMLPTTTDEGLPIFYMIRLFGYLLILIAILDKNFNRKK
jgi:hypothetical protein